MDFDPENDVRTENNFLDWGLMRDFDTCRQNYAQFIAHWAILPQLRLILPILAIFVLIFSVMIFQRH